MRNFDWSSRLIPDNASTIVRLLQIRTKVITAVDGIPRIVEGIGQFMLPIRKAP